MVSRMKGIETRNRAVAGGLCSLSLDMVSRMKGIETLREVVASGDCDL